MKQSDRNLTLGLATDTQQAFTSTQRIESGIDRAAAGSEQVAAELERLRTLIVDYATTPMTFEQMLAAAFGEQRANEIMGITDEQQAALLEQWHAHLPGDNHADHQV